MSLGFERSGRMFQSTNYETKFNDECSREVEQTNLNKTGLNTKYTQNRAINASQLYDYDDFFQTPKTDLSSQ